MSDPINQERADQARAEVRFAAGLEDLTIRLPEDKKPKTRFRQRTRYLTAAPELPEQSATLEADDGNVPSDVHTYQEFLSALHDKAPDCYYADFGSNRRALIEDIPEKLEALAFTYGRKPEGTGFPMTALTRDGAKAFPNLQGTVTFTTFKNLYEKDPHALFLEIKMRYMLHYAVQAQLDETISMTSIMNKSIRSLYHWTHHFGQQVDAVMGGTDNTADPGDVQLLKARMESQQRQILAKDNEINQLKDRLRQASLSTGVSQMGQKKSTKVEVTDFYGEKDHDKVDFESWYYQMTDKLKVNADHFTDDQARLVEIKSHLKGQAMRNVQPYLRSTHPDQITTADRLLAHLWDEYDEPNKKENAEAAFRRCLQSKYPTFAEFKNAFVRLAGECNKPKADWKFEFKEKLQLQYQVALVPSYMDPKVTFDAYARLAAELSFNYVQAEQRRGGNSNSRGNRGGRGGRGGNRGGRSGTGDGNSNPVPATSNNNSTKPKGRLTEDQVRQYAREGRCFHCGEKDHVARNCPEKEERLSAIVRAYKPASNLEKLNQDADAEDSENGSP